MATERYEALHAKYLRDGEKLLAEGDYVQASEKYWGAVAQMIKMVAASRGLRHSSHPALREVIQTVYRDTEDGEFVSLMRSAERLHVNFYENDLDPETVLLHSKEALELVSKLRTLVPGVQA